MLRTSLKKWFLLKNVKPVAPLYRNWICTNQHFCINYLKYASLCSINSKKTAKQKVNKSSIIKNLEGAYEASIESNTPKTTKIAKSKAKIDKEKPKQQEVNTELTEKGKLLKIIKKHKEIMPEQVIQPVAKIVDLVKPAVAQSIPVVKEEAKSQVLPKKAEKEAVPKSVEVNKKILKLSKESVSKVSNYREKLNYLKLAEQSNKPQSERDMILSQYSERDSEVKEDKYKILEDAIKRVERQSSNANRIMNTSGGLTGKANAGVTGNESDYQHPVISKASNKMEEMLVNEYKYNRGEYVSMISNLK